MSSYSNETPFDASMLVHFRERISANLVNLVNQEMVKGMLETTSDEPSEKKREEKEISDDVTRAAEPPSGLTNLKSEPKNRGKLILDATCAPGDISYPTDLELLNQAGKSVEFGAKLSASCFDGYVFLDHISWDNFNESGDFKTLYSCI